MNGADIGAGVKLNEMIMDVARDGGSGVWSATVKMNLTIPTSNGLKVVIDVQCLGGRIDGEGIRFDKVPWHRTVIDTGQKDDIEGNPLVLILAPEGGLKGTFEGSDGMSFTLTRRSK